MTSHRIRKDGWLYRFAYGDTPADKPPTAVSLLALIGLIAGQLLWSVTVGVIVITLHALAIACIVLFVLVLGAFRNDLLSPVAAPNAQELGDHAIQIDWPLIALMLIAIIGFLATYIRFALGRRNTNSIDSARMRGYLTPSCETD